MRAHGIVERSMVLELRQAIPAVCHRKESGLSGLGDRTEDRPTDRRLGSR